MEENIIQIDSKIRDFFEEEKKKLPEYISNLEELKKTLQQENLPSRIKINLEKSIERLSAKIEKIESEKEFNFYLSESADLIERYNQALNRPQKISFTGKQIKDQKEIKEKEQIVFDFMKVAQKYHKHYITKVDRKKAKIKEQKKTVCDVCGKSNFITDECYLICDSCSTEKDILEFASSYKDSDRINISVKYTYDRKVHFRDCINQYQAKQNCTIDKKVYDDLEKILESHHLLIESDRKEERFSKVTKEHIMIFLKELGYSKHYENIILIHYNLTGKKPDNISHLEDKLLQDFDVLVEAYDKLFKNKIDRKNFLNCTNLLYQLLLKHKHPCKKEDFNVIKTIERKNFHDSVCAELFKYLSWNYVPLS